MLLAPQGDGSYITKVIQGIGSENLKYRFLSILWPQTTQICNGHTDYQICMPKYINFSHTGCGICTNKYP